MRISSFFYTIGQGFKNLGRNKWYTLASIATISACLFLFGLFYSIITNFENVVNLNEIVYCWNRTNVNNSVSIVRSKYWDACAYCHIGHQLQLITQMKHKEMIPKIEQRIKECISNVNNGIYEQR